MRKPSGRVIFFLIFSNHTHANTVAKLASDEQVLTAIKKLTKRSQRVNFSLAVSLDPIRIIRIHEERNFSDLSHVIPDFIESQFSSECARSSAGITCKNLRVDAASPQR